MRGSRSDFLWTWLSQVSSGRYNPTAGLYKSASILFSCFLENNSRYNDYYLKPNFCSRDSVVSEMMTRR